MRSNYNAVRFLSGSCPLFVGVKTCSTLSSELKFMLKKHMAIFRKNMLTIIIVMLAILLVFLVIHIYDRRIEHLEKMTHSGIPVCHPVNLFSLPDKLFKRYEIFINS